MARDFKYGKVTLEHGTIGEDEPVVVFRATDVNLPKVLMYYYLFCMKTGSPKRHLHMLLETLQFVQDWQSAHRDEVRVPTSMGSKKWMDS